MTTSTGAVAERYAYTAYGQPTILNASGTVLTSSLVGNRYTYTGREWDETLGLHHFRARWMSPLAGRFLGRDPIGYVDGFNAYQLLISSVLRWADPDGATTIEPTEKAAIQGCNCYASDSLGVPTGSMGYTKCENEAPVSVVQGPLPGALHEDCFKKCGMEECIKEHEEHHISQFKELCPGACKNRCGKSLDGWLIGVANANDCPQKLECYAHLKELECLKKLYQKHLALEKAKQGMTCVPGRGNSNGKAKNCSTTIKYWFDDSRKKMLSPDPDDPDLVRYGCVKYFTLPKW